MAMGKSQGSRTISPGICTAPRHLEPTRLGSRVATSSGERTLALQSPASQDSRAMSSSLVPPSAEAPSSSSPSQGQRHTSDPHSRMGTLCLLQKGRILEIASRMRARSSVPSVASTPVQAMPELFPDAPDSRCGDASRRTVLRLLWPLPPPAAAGSESDKHSDSCRAMDMPTTPPPIMATSKGWAPVTSPSEGRGWRAAMADPYSVRKK